MQFKGNRQQSRYFFIKSWLDTHTHAHHTTHWLKREDISDVQSLIVFLNDQDFANSQCFATCASCDPEVAHFCQWSISFYKTTPKSHSPVDNYT